MNSGEQIKQAFELAVARYRKGELAEAEQVFRQILNDLPEHAPSRYNLGLVLHRLGRLAEAITVYRQALALSPNAPDAHNSLAQALREQGRYTEAEQAYRAALDLNPTYVEALLNLGLLLEDQQRLPEAETTYHEAIAINSDFAGAWINLGNVQEAQGRVREAEESFRRALRITPQVAGIHMNLANVLKSQGRMEAAEETYRAALALQPNYAEAYSNLITVKRYHSVDDPDVANMLALLRSPDLPDDSAMHLHFALGKIYDECGEHDDAFVHYREGNRLKRQTLSFNAATFAEYVNRLIDTFDASFFSGRRTVGVSSELPVFIVGMPRSGTTLVEQIISSHPAVHGAGELGTLNALARGLAAGGGTYPEAARALDRDALARLANEYEQRLRQGADPKVLRISDKMPLNHLHLGLAALLFPCARVIHCQRDPLDVCLSIYFQYFRSGNDYAYDLSDIGLYYRQYERLMAHWRDVLPLQMYEIQYEDLIAEQERNIRNLVKFLDLPWHERCLSFTQNRRPIQTGSAWQARQPIYRSSVHRWRNYEKFLAPLKEVLE